MTTNSTPTAREVATSALEALREIDPRGCGCDDEETCIWCSPKKAAIAKLEAFLAVPQDEGILSEIASEVARATTKFPTWPTDPLHAFAVVGEEFRETQKEILQLVYEPHKSSKETVKKEATQLAAMSLRFLASLDRYEYTPRDQHSQSEPPQEQQPDDYGKSRSLGDVVTWTSQSGGYRKTKEGKIIEIVKAGQRPSPAIANRINAGFSRKEKSYVVQVGNKFYWPRVSQLAEKRAQAKGENP